MKWEYRVIFIDRDKAELCLNTLGEEGWELVGLSPYPIYRSSWVGIFKRPRLTPMRAIFEPGGEAMPL